MTWRHMGNKGYNIENICQMKNKLGRLVGTFEEQNSQTPKIFKLPYPLSQPQKGQNLGLFYSNGLGRSSQ
jgi:hypothetical protein